jgi:hypothetical protein
VEFNDKQVRPICHNKMVLQNVPIEPSWNVQEAFLHKVWNLNFGANRCLTKAFNSKTPQEAWSGRKPNVCHLKVYGCKAFAHVPDEKRTKLLEILFVFNSQC